MKPPPPMLPAVGYVTAMAKAVATAASTAVPPRARIAAPMSDAKSDEDTTTPSFAATPRSGGCDAGDVCGPGTSAPTSPSRQIVVFMAASGTASLPQVTRRGLLFAQRRRGIYAGGAPGWDEARRAADQTESRHRKDDGDRVVRREAKQQRLGIAGCVHRDTRACSHS